MNQVAFQKLQATIESLERSTAVVYQYNGLMAWLGGRCSAYLSHHRLTFSASAQMPKSFGCEPMLSIGNSRNEMLVGGQPPDEEGLRALSFWWPGHQVIVEQVPSHLLCQLLGPAEGWLGFFGGGRNRPSLVWVAFPLATVARWNEDGKPVFVDPQEAMAGLLGLSVDCLDREVTFRQGYLAEQIGGTGPWSGREALKGLAALRHLEVARFEGEIRQAFLPATSPEVQPQYHWDGNEGLDETLDGLPTV